MSTKLNTKAFLYFLPPLLIIPVIGLLAPIATMVFWGKLIVASEIITFLVMITARLLCQSEEDVIYCEEATFRAMAFAAVMFLVSLCTFFLFPGINITLPMINEKIIIPSDLFIGLSIMLAAMSGFIAIMPFTGKWANIWHTTIIFLASVLCFGLFISSISGIWFTGPVFLIGEAVIFIYFYRLTSVEIQKKEKEEKRKTTYGEVEIDFRLTDMKMHN
jgi:hypothetical protein